MIETQLQGQNLPDTVAGERINPARPAGGFGSAWRPIPQTRIANARPIQTKAASDHAFFQQHGFVLLDAPTAMIDWDDVSATGQTYLPEVEALVRERLLPGLNIEIRQPPSVLRRGVGTGNPQYGTGVHQDYGTTADDCQHNVAAYVGAEGAAQWRKSFEREDVESFMILDFWRTTGMSAPLRHMPLALCDPTSVDPDDIVPTVLGGIAPGGGVTHHLGLRHNAGQRWFYYPDMTPDEVLVFKLFQLVRDERPPRFRACFHTAVEDPATPTDAPRRQSCEHRVSVMVLSD